MTDHIEEEALFSARGDGLFARAVRNPWQCLLWMVVIGFCLGAASIILHVHSVSFDGTVLEKGVMTAVHGAPTGGKEVGYLMAPNWGVFGVIVTPLLVFFGLQMIGAMDRVLEQAANRGMLRDDKFVEIPVAEVQAAWKRHRRRNRVIFAVMFALVLIYAFSDWWDVVAQPMLCADFIPPAHSMPPTGHWWGDVAKPALCQGNTFAAFTDQTMEYDWSVSSIFHNGPVGVGALMVFTFVAYLLLAGFAPAFAFAVVISALHFVGFITSLGPNRHWRLAAMPGEEAKDTHCGFDVFAGFFNNLLLCMLCILVGLELMVLQNAYLRTFDPNFIAFILNGVAELKGTWLPDWPKWFAEPLLVNAANPQAGLSYLLFPFVCIVAVGASWIMLRSTAMKARAFSEDHLEAVAAKTGRTKKTVTAALKRMKFWPVGWIKLNQLLAIMGVMFLGLTSYRLLIPLFLLLAAVALGKFWGMIKPSADTILARLFGGGGGDS